MLALVKSLVEVPEKKSNAEVQKVLLYASLGPAALVMVLRLLPEDGGSVLAVPAAIAIMALGVSFVIRIFLYVAAIQGHGEIINYDKRREFVSDGLFIPGLVRQNAFATFHTVATLLLLVGLIALIVLSLLTLWWI